MRNEKSAGAVVFRKDNDKIIYLLLHYASGHWDFPKGHIENQETEEQTTKREIKEETGIDDVEFVTGFRDPIKYFFRAKGEMINKTVVFFLVETKTEEVKISFEHKGFKWLEYPEAHKELTFKNAKDTLQKADEFLKGKGSLRGFLKS